MLDNKCLLEQWIVNLKKAGVPTWVLTISEDRIYQKTCESKNPREQIVIELNIFNKLGASQRALHNIIWN